MDLAVCFGFFFPLLLLLFPSPFPRAICPFSEFTDRAMRYMHRGKSINPGPAKREKGYPRMRSWSWQRIKAMACFMERQGPRGGGRGRKFCLILMSETHLSVDRLPTQYAGTWLGWPQDPVNWRDNAKHVQPAFVEVATAISRFEPVTVCANASQVPPSQRERSTHLISDLSLETRKRNEPIFVQWTV